MGKKGTGKKKTDKFEKLGDFRDTVAQSSIDEIKKRISDLAILEMVEKQTMKEDPDVEEARDAFKNVTQPYRESLSEIRLKMEFCKRVIDDKDGGATSSKVEETSDAESEEDE